MCGSRHMRLQGSGSLTRNVFNCIWFPTGLGSDAEFPPDVGNYDATATCIESKYIRLAHGPYLTCTSTSSCRQMSSNQQLLLACLIFLGTTLISQSGSPRPSQPVRAARLSRQKNSGVAHDRPTLHAIVRRSMRWRVSCVVYVDGVVRVRSLPGCTNQPACRARPM